MTRKSLLTLNSLQMLLHPFLLENARRVVQRPATSRLQRSKSMKMLETKTWSPKRCSRTRSMMQRPLQQKSSPKLRVEDQRPRSRPQRSNGTSGLRSKHQLNRGLRRISRTPSLQNTLHLQLRSQPSYQRPKLRDTAMLSPRRFPSRLDTSTSSESSRALPKSLEHHPLRPMRQPFTTLLANCLPEAPTLGA